MAIIGPGAIQNDQIAPQPTLDGASEYEYVTILNPLTDDFAIQVAQTKPVDMPMTIAKDTRTAGITTSDRDVAQVYGFQLKNPDFSSRKHILNQTVIKSGKTINLRGDDAQVAVRQLVNEMIQREGKTVHMADPVLRREYEGRIIISRGSVEDLMDNKMQSTQTVINETINKSNEVQDEEAFANLNDTRTEVGTAETGNSVIGDSDSVAKTTTSRAKK